MRLFRRCIWLVVAALLSLFVVSPLAAQGTVAETVRTVLAVGRVSSVVDTRMHFKLLRISLPASASTTYRGAHSTIYQLSGTLAMETGNEKRILQEGEGTFIAAGTDAILQASGSAPAIFLHFLLVSSTDLDKPAESPPAVVTELHRMAIPTAALKPGPYEFSMTRITRGPGKAAPPHMRSGAALYYVLADGVLSIWPTGPDGIITGESRDEMRPAGAIQEEPYGFVHTWSSLPNSRVILLVGNINLEGTADIIVVK